LRGAPQEPGVARGAGPVVDLLQRIEDRHERIESAIEELQDRRSGARREEFRSELLRDVRAYLLAEQVLVEHLRGGNVAPRATPRALSSQLPLLRAVDELARLSGTDRRWDQRLRDLATQVACHFHVVERDLFEALRRLPPERRRRLARWLEREADPSPTLR
jgi:hypothetical protein